MATYALDFEKPLLELETKLAELKRHAATGEGSGTAGNLDGEIRRLEEVIAEASGAAASAEILPAATALARSLA